MNRKISARLTAFLCLIGMGQAGASLITPGDFSASAFVEDFDGLGLPLSNATPIAIGSNTFSVSTSVLRYLDPVSGSYGSPFSGGVVGTSESDTAFMDVTFGVPVPRAGAYVSQGNAAWTATVEFYDALDNLLGTASLGTAAFGVQFAGWEIDPGQNDIARVRFIDTSATTPPSVLFIDNLTLDAIPEPTAVLALLGALAFGISRGWRRINPRHGVSRPDFRSTLSS